MDTTPYETPNLASILQTLSAYAPPQPTPTPDLEEGEYDPSEAHIHPSGPHPKHSTPPLKTLPNPKPPPGPHPSTITTWPPAIRHITIHIASNPDKMQRIRHLIHTQHQHERQWWKAREELVKKIYGREEGRKRLDSVLYVIYRSILQQPPPIPAPAIPFLYAEINVRMLTLRISQGGRRRRHHDPVLPVRALRGAGAGGV